MPPVPPPPGYATDNNIIMMVADNSVCVWGGEAAWCSWCSLMLPIMSPIWASLWCYLVILVRDLVGDKN